MNINTFNKLSIQQKGETVFSSGKYLAVRFYYNYAVNLYLLDDLLIEVFYFSETNKIEKIEVLTDDKILNMYIDFNTK